MRRLFLSLTAISLIAVTALAATAAPVHAQSALDIIKKRAEEAKKKADEIKRKADSTAKAANAARVSADSAKSAAEQAARAVESMPGTAMGASTATTPATATPAAGGRTTQQGAAPAAAAAGATRGRPASAGAPQSAGQSAAQPAPSQAAPQSAAPSTPTATLSKTAAKVEEQTLFTGEAGAAYVLSPRGQHVAGVALRGSRLVVVHDGVDGPKFDEIGAPQNSGKIVFSDDGERYMYVGRAGTDWVVMVDGKEIARGRPFSQVSGMGAVMAMGFTPGGKHVYFNAVEADATNRPFHRLYVDGKPDPATSNMINPLFSPDGEHRAYIVDVNTSTQQRQVLLIDGKPAPYVAGEPQFTTDGLHLFTKAAVPGTNTIQVLVDGKPFMRVGGVQLFMAPVGSGVLGSVFTEVQGRRGVFVTVGNQKVPGSECFGSGGIHKVAFTPDAKHWAVVCQDSPTAFWVMADGKKGRDYASITSDLAFTPDGRVVYQASMNNRYFLVVGDQESDAFQFMVPETLQPNGRGGPPFQSPAVMSGSHIAVIGNRNNARFIEVDGKAYPAPNAAALSFSPDGSHFAALGGNAGSEVLVDGKPLPTGQAVAFNPAADKQRYVFSPDGKHIAYPTMTASGPAVAVDGRIIRTATTGNYSLTFTPDSKHLLWMGRANSGQMERLYVDGEPTLEVETTLGLINDPDIWWTMGSDGALTFAAQNQGSLKRYRVMPGSGSIDAMLAKAVKP